MEESDWDALAILLEKVYGTPSNADQQHTDEMLSELAERDADSYLWKIKHHLGRK